MLLMYFRVETVKIMKCIYKHFIIQINRYIHLLLLPPYLIESNFCPRRCFLFLPFHSSGFPPFFCQYLCYFSPLVVSGLCDLSQVWSRGSFSNLSLTKALSPLELTNIFRNKPATCSNTAPFLWHNYMYD